MHSPRDFFSSTRQCFSASDYNLFLLPSTQDEFYSLFVTKSLMTV